MMSSATQGLKGPWWAEVDRRRTPFRRGPPEAVQVQALQQARAPSEDIFPTGAGPSAGATQRRISQGALTALQGRRPSEEDPPECTQ